MRKRKRKNVSPEQRLGNLIGQRAIDEDKFAKAVDAVGEAAVPLLVEGLDHRREAARNRCLRQLARLRPELVRDRIATILDGPDDQSRKLLLLGLECALNAGDPELASHLRRYVNHSNPVVSAKAVCALGVSGDTMMEDRLIAMLEQKDDIAAAAVQGLAKMRSQRGAEPVVRTLISRQRKARKWRIQSIVIVSAMVLLLIGFAIAIDASSMIGSFTSNIGSVFAAVVAMNSFTQFRKKSVAALKTLEDPKAIGALALCAVDKELQSDARAALAPLLDKVGFENQPGLSPDQMRAMITLLREADEPLRVKTLHALAWIGDETALTAVEEMAVDEGTPSLLRDRANDLLPMMRERVERQRESRALLRAADDEEDRSLLLRASDGLRDDIPSGQLLRPAE